MILARHGESDYIEYLSSNTFRGDTKCFKGNYMII
jgi:hypothetical protein